MKPPAKINTRSSTGRKTTILLIIFSAMILAWFLFSNLDFGKYDSLEEAIEKGIPYPVKDVIHIQNMDDVTGVMYATEADRQQFPHIVDDIPAVAFFGGNDQEGWQNIGPNQWTHYEAEHMTNYTASFKDFDERGITRHELYIAYGNIYDDEIVKVEVKTYDKGDFEEAEITTHQGKRYYFYWKEGPVNTLIARGLSKDGAVIDTTCA